MDSNTTHDNSTLTTKCSVARHVEEGQVAEAAKAIGQLSRQLIAGQVQILQSRQCGHGVRDRARQAVAVQVQVLQQQQRSQRGR